MRRYERRYDFTDAQLDKMVDNIGGPAVAMKAIAHKGTVMFHEGPVFISHGIVIVSPTEGIKVTFVTGRQLGFTRHATYDAIFAKAAEAGLHQCRDQVIRALSGTWDYRVVYIGTLISSEDTGNPIIRRVEISRSELFSEDVQDLCHLYDPDDVWAFEL